MIPSNPTRTVKDLSLELACKRHAEKSRIQGGWDDGHSKLQIKDGALVVYDAYGNGKGRVDLENLIGCLAAGQTYGCFVDDVTLVEYTFDTFTEIGIVRLDCATRPAFWTMFPMSFLQL